MEGGTMKTILNQDQKLKPLKVGTVVEGKLIAKKPMAAYFDLGIYGTGIIYGKEFKLAKEELKKLKIGDKILAKVVDIDNEDGFVELSIAGASKEIALELLRQKKESGETITVKIFGANKGGLLTKVLDVPAFLPISQIVFDPPLNKEEIDKEKFLEKLKSFVGREMEVKILGILDDGHVILSEKLAKMEQESKEYEVGRIIEGKVEGIFDYGILVKFNSSLGLISEKEKEFKLGETVKAKIVAIEDGKIFLTTKI